MIDIKATDHLILFCNDIIKEKTSHDGVLLNEYIIDLSKKLTEYKENDFDYKT